MWPWADRGLVALEDGGSLHYRNLVIRNTEMGNGMFMVAIASWLAGVNYSVSVAYALSFMMVGILVWARFLSALQLHGVEVRCLSHTEGFQGDSVSVRVGVGSVKDRHRRIMVAFMREEDEVGYADLRKVDTSTTNQIELEMRPSARGRNSLPPILLYSHSPFSMVSARCAVVLRRSVIAYARPVEHDSTEGSVAEGTGSRRTGAAADDVSRLDAYRPGESPRVIAWKQYAKSGKLLSKQFEEEVGLNSGVISYRDYPDLPPGDRMAGLLTWRVLQAELSGMEYVVELPAQTVGPSTGQREKALTAIALM